MIRLDEARETAQNEFGRYDDGGNYRVEVDDESIEEWRDGFLFFPKIVWMPGVIAKPLAGAMAIFCRHSGDIEIIPSYAVVNPESYLLERSIRK